MARSVEPPRIEAITQLSLPEYETTQLANGMDMHMLIGGSEPVMKIEMVFGAGAWHEHKPGAAEFMAGLLSEGTKQMSSVELAEFIESRGATLQTRGGVDTVRVRLYTLTRFLPELLDVTAQVINSPAFDIGELRVYAENKVERLKIDLRKNEILAYRHLTESIFGAGHPYGRNIVPEEYLSLQPEDLVQHHANYISPSTGKVFVSGSFGAKEIDLIQHSLGQWNPAHANGVPVLASYSGKSLTGYYEFEGPQSHQAAIRIGRRLFTQSHPDYSGLFMLNTILGGYFGSRLMTEIRENKGMTYGIYSSVDTFASDGCFYISTETATGNVENVINAIRQEMRKLQTGLVPVEELHMARNYMMGHLMTQLDGPFSSMDFIKSMKIEHLDDEYFAKMVRIIQEMDSEGIRDLAIKYFDPEDWVTIVVK